MSSRPSSRPSKTELWPQPHGKLTMHLKPSDRILFRKVNQRGFPEAVGISNVGKKCTVIFGHKKMEGLYRVNESGPLEVYSGRSVKILPEDDVYTCLVDVRGLPSSVGVGNAGKAITIIVHEE